jgi:hypothetical protein
MRSIALLPLALLCGCAISATGIRTVDPATGESFRLRNIAFKTVLVEVDRDEQSAAIAVDGDGAYTMRVGATSTGFDGVTGVAALAEVIAPLVAQYLAGRMVAGAVGGAMAELKPKAEAKAEPDPAPTPATLNPSSVMSYYDFNWMPGWGTTY